tara:strand:- start:1089 stop:1607 length:519 start_codon:yes stop_codon:yes gene_type:complete
MKKYTTFLNEDSDNKLEDEGITKDDKRELKDAADEKERLNNVDAHDKEVTEMSEKTEGHISRKIKFDIDIESTQHAIDRLNRKGADGKAAYEPITFKEVNAVISKATEEIIVQLVKDEMDVNKDSFILQRKSDGLTVVGKMNTNKGDLKFVVITLYRGAEFRIGANQTVIKV